jgi:hypothetical protein
MEEVTDETTDFHMIYHPDVVLLLVIFRRVPCHQGVPLCPVTFQGALCHLKFFLNFYW